MTASVVSAIMELAQHMWIIVIIRDQVGIVMVTLAPVALNVIPTSA